MARVNTIVAGTQKGGTTALSCFLREHPQVRAARSKELHFFDVDARYLDRSGKPNYAWYESMFPADDGRPVAFESTPAYMYIPEAVDRMAAYNPDLKFIFLLRNPVTRAYSHYLMTQSKGCEPATFEEALRLEPARMTLARQRDDDRQALRMFSYTDRGFYSRQLEKTWSLFPRSQSLVILSEDLKKRHRETMSQVHAFLGLDDHPVESAEILVSPPAPPISEPARAYLRSVFTPEIESLECLIDRDLSCWRN